jgi:outer membrane protein assembly factor BamB
MKSSPFRRPFSNARRRLLWARAALPLAFCLAVNASALADPAAERFWPQWRGPLSTGAAPQADPPVRWSESENVKWKTAIPGEGDATPVIWSDRLFILSAVATGKKTETPTAPGAPDEIYQFVVLCLDRDTGKVLWQKVARQEAPHEGRQENNTFASGSPVTDGKLVLAYFGSRGLHCYDVNGNLKWEKDFGKMKTKMGFGEGSSPALGGDKVVFVWDHEGEDFIARWTNKRAKNFGAPRATNRPVGRRR